MGLSSRGNKIWYPALFSPPDDHPLKIATLAGVNKPDHGVKLHLRLRVFSDGVAPQELPYV